MKRLPLIVMLLCAGMFVYGTVALFKLRYEMGDVYPKYSSLRADPMGTMAFYESLEKLPGLTVRRDHSSANRLPEEKNVTYLHLAAGMSDWKYLPEDLFREIDQFLSRGGRLVITLSPEASNYRPVPSLGSEERRLERMREQQEKKKADEKKTDEKKADEKKADEKKSGPVSDEQKKKSERKLLEEMDLVPVSERWGLDFRIVDLTQGVDHVYEPVRVVNRTDLPLPRALDWHSGIVLTGLAKEWETVYSRGEDAVMAERKFGRGTVVIATDSFFVSNQAMQKDRQPQFLAWLIGSSRTVVFDESHLGIAESSGVAMLMRKYHLQGLALGFLLLAGLFIWKNTVSLVPPVDEEDEDHIAGKEAAAGFVNLLRRSISPRELLSVCFAEWKKSVAQTGKYSAPRREQAEAVFRAENSVPAQERNPLRAYHAIHSTLHRRNLETPPPNPAAATESATPPTVDTGPH